MRTTKTVLIAVLLILSTTTLWAADSEKHIQEGIKLHDAGDYEGAIAAFEAALENDPSNSSAIYELANTYFAQKDFKSCIDTASEGLKTPSEIKGLFHALVGSCYSSLGKSKKALRVFQDGLKIDPNNPMLNFNIAITLTGVGDYPAAIKHFETAIDSRPSYASPYFMLGELYRETGGRVSSLFYFTRFMTIEPNSPRAEYASAVVFNLLSSGIEVESESKVTVTVPHLEDDNPMSSLEMSLSIAGTSKLVMEEDLELRTEAEKEVAALTSFFQMVLETPEDDEARPQSTTTWSQAVGPVLEILRRGAFDTLAYVMTMRADIEGGRDWVEANPEKVSTLSQLLVDSRD